MPVARTFRLCTMQLPSDFDVVALRLYNDGVAVDVAATIDSSVPPTAGTIDGLRDGSGCLWAGTIARAPGFYVEWNFDTPTMVTDLIYEGVGMRGALMLVDGQPAEMLRSGSQFHILFALESLLALAPEHLWKLDASTEDIVSGVVANRYGGNIVPAQEQVGQPWAFAPGNSGYVSAAIGGLNSGDFSAAFDLQVVGKENVVVIECGGNAGWSVQVETGGYFKINVGGTGGSLGALNTTFQIGDGVPRRLGFTYRRSERLATLYVGGYAIAQAVLALPNSETVLTIGSRFGAYPISAGSRIANVALWRRALSPDEMMQTRYRDTWDWLSHVDREYRTAILSKNNVLPQGLQATNYLMPGCARDVEFGGNGRIYGTVTRKNTPANVPLSRRVRLHRSRDGLLVRETYSRADGYFSFDEINPRYEYDVIAWDHEMAEFSTVANNQRAEVPA